MCYRACYTILAHVSALQRHASDGCTGCSPMLESNVKTFFGDSATDSAEAGFAGAGSFALGSGAGSAQSAMAPEPSNPVW